MAEYDHKAVRAAYPNAVTIRDNIGVFDASNNEITIDDAKVQAEADKIKAAYDAKKYQRDRVVANHNGRTKIKSGLRRRNILTEGSSQLRSNS